MEIWEACAKGFVLAIVIFSVGYMMIDLYQNRLRISQMMRRYIGRKRMEKQNGRTRKTQNH